MKVLICFDDGETASFSVGEKNRGECVKGIKYSRVDKWVEIRFEDKKETYVGVPFIITITRNMEETK